MNSSIRISRLALLAASLLVVSGAAFAGTLESLTVCADPGNMPLSNNKGEGFENKIAQVIGAALGTGVNYYWRPSVQRGLMRTTLSAGDCDLWMDMASGTEGAMVLRPLYRSTFVLVYRNDKGIDIKSFDDPALKKLRVGVFQVSAIREALADHDVVANTVVHYLSHNADMVPDNQPSYQVQQVIDGSLDIAAAWGPMAGYYKKVLHAPLIVQPVNLMENNVPLEFNMSLAVPKDRPDIKAVVERVMVEQKDAIHKILTDYGVPLVVCPECIISGDLPSHGPYHPLHRPEMTPQMQAQVRRKRMAELKQWLAQGASPNHELDDAVIANDIDRVRYLLKVGARVGWRDGDGYTPLINAARFGFIDVARFLIDHKADVNQADTGSWTPLMYAAWNDDAALVALLVKSGAKINVKDNHGLSPLAIAAQNGKVHALEALVAAGADVNTPVAKGGYTPLMLASVGGSSDLAQALIKHGAKVNAANPGGVTALMIAAAGDHSELAQLLLKSGADVNAHSSDGRTALSIAKENGNTAVLKVIEDAAERGAASSG
ncbi:MAG TPA: quinoprotein dehydrogenase-associated putative ABC transporter substrate-binding protein [Steroidobacteraceae bacterium]|nr:quinoprotein dehydrogenase-associated putative ABC transporter substrate-binding protein [Steroidobacteraceae bacterium]